MFIFLVVPTHLTRSLPGQIFPGCHPRVGLLPRWLSAAELHVLNDKYIHQWNLPIYIN